MANFYADEQFPKDTTIALLSLGHDVLTVQEAGNANQKIPDEDVLAFATEQNRAVLTINRYDFIRLHKQSSNHSGIIACSENTNFERLAEKIHEAVSLLISSDDPLANSLNQQLIRVYRDA
jgi:predicted nuclease of predicted toxin-antitoxin system